MIDHPIRELVNESFLPISMEDSNALTRHSRTFHPEQDQDGIELNYEEYFEYNRNELRMNLWKSAYKRQGLSQMNKRFLKMSVTKHISSHPRDIGKDKTFYFLGKRYTKVNELRKIAEHYNWEWETKDKSKADFIILGENITWEDAQMNEDLNLPVVMDESIRVHYHFLFEVDNTAATVIDQDTVAAFLNNGDYDHFKMVVNMIKFLKEDALNDENKFRLIRAYVKTFSGRFFDLKNKEHVWISDTVQKYCHPYHRVFVTKSYLGHTKFEGWRTSFIRGNYVPKLYVDNILNPDQSGFKVNFENIHMSPDMNLVGRNDIETGNKFSELTSLVITRPSDYAKLEVTSLYEYNLYQVKLSIVEIHTLSMFVQMKSGKPEIICTGIDTSGTYYSSPSDTAFQYIHKDKWDENYESNILPLLYKVLESCEVIDGKLKFDVNTRTYLKYASQIDELYSSFYKHASEDFEFLHMSKFKRRKNALALL